MRVQNHDKAECVKVEATDSRLAYLARRRASASQVRIDLCEVSV